MNSEQASRKSGVRKKSNSLRRFQWLSRTGATSSRHAIRFPTSDNSRQGSIRSVVAKSPFRGCLFTAHVKWGFSSTDLSAIGNCPAPLSALTADNISATSKNRIPYTGDNCFFTSITVAFLKPFALGFWETLPLLFSLSLGIALLGCAVSRKEGWSRFGSLYWSFITATTVGYGDLRPVNRASHPIRISRSDLDSH
jgi:hypothetical protein